MNQLPAVDLFAGAGGLSLGALAAGVDIQVHVDNDPDSCATLRANRRWWGSAEVVEADISGVTGREIRRIAGVSSRDPFLVIGGAPCQPFSKAAYWTDPGAEAAYRRARAAGKHIARPAPPAL